ncbi:hypothetical protein CTI12_AA069870 [Artemisia annua]|uniref:Uncharacterized protein n=1 Tax=Artemisia annua TaxID=35608 RepID=A0A2U1Q689_ARTAN|nr:hypothetical protein CTI12_AA069870 [Artemisia annua]
MSGAPSFSGVRRPGSSSTTSNINSRSNKPVSTQYPLHQNPPSFQDVDQRAKRSDIDQIKEGGTTDKPMSRGDLTRVDSD